MKKLGYLFLSFLFISTFVFAQEGEKKERKPGHGDISKFRQLKQELPDPNNQHTASGAPGHEYTQQKVDYVMNISIDEKTNRLSGDQTITYKNNSKDNLEYLWVQLDQNMRARDSKTPEVQSKRFRSSLAGPVNFTKDYLTDTFDGGFNIDYVKDAQGKNLKHMINRTMMKINLPTPLASGGTFVFKMKWWYNIPPYITVGGRSGYEPFPDGNNNYTIAQFFPRLAVYDNVEGWQNMQFWGRSEWALEFGDYDVKLTVPADHIVDATGELQNEKEVLSREQRKRWAQARKSFKDPVFIVTQQEAEIAEKGRTTKTKTWHFNAKNVRDFAFASSRKYIWDAMAVNINGTSVMAVSLYPKEGNPLWEEHSTRVVANTLEEYSKLTFDYPYSKAIWRPKPDGTYSDRVKNGMIGVITHEVGHNFFPMIVNSDERQWTWMDEGINSFVEILAELDYDPNFDSGNLPKDIVRYMSIDQDRLSPIMTQGDNVYNFGPNAYTKPAAGLYMLRQTIMGPELFDEAFRTYSRRWKFKHPTPADFFRTMEDASAMDLDWFWRGWFYTTDYNDMGVKSVKSYYTTDKPTEKGIAELKRYNLSLEEYKNKLVFFAEGDPNTSKDAKKATDIGVLKDHLAKMTDAEKAELKEIPNYFYEVTFEKPGGLVLPLIVELTYEDGTKERKKYPAQIWNKRDKEVTKVYATGKKITNIIVDPDLETADIDITNNSWPKKKQDSQFDSFKKELKN